MGPIHGNPVIGIEPILLNTPDHADHALPGRVLREVSELEALADWVLAGPVPFGELLVDDHHGLRIGRVVLGEEATAAKRDAHRFEITPGHGALIGVDETLTRRRGVSFDA